MLLLFLVCAGMLGAVLGALAARTALVPAAPSARERAEHAQAVALARAVLMTPDALDLRDQASKIVERADARAANRKET